MVSPVCVSPRMIGQLIDDGPRYFGSSDGWYWIVPCFGMFDELLRRELQHERHDAEVGVERLQRLVRVLGRLQRLELDAP